MAFVINKPLKNEEWFPVVTEDGTLITTAPRSVCHDGKSKLLHPVVHLHLFNEEGRLFLQKRSAKKDIQPGKWDTSVGGHVAPAENINEALQRETYEELGLKNLSTSFIIKYLWESPRERELVFSFSAKSNEVPVTDRNEIEEGKFWSLEEIRESTGKGIFTPNFEYEFEMINAVFISSGLFHGIKDPV